MGQQQSIANQLNKSKRTLQIIYHPQLQINSSAVVLLQQSNKTIQYTTLITSKQPCKRWQKQLKQYFNHIDTTYFYLPIKYHYKSTQFCGTAGIINVYYQYFPTTLLHQIVKRNKLNAYFQQKYIWKLLYTYCRAAYQLHSKDKKLGKIALQSIYINHQVEQIKIATGLSFFSDSMVDEIYAPQARYTSLNKHNVKIQEIFCIGIVILCMVLLQSKPPKTQNPSTTLILNKLDSVKNIQFYSKQLKDLVFKMCKITPQQRITAFEIVKYIQNKQIQQKNKKRAQFKTDENKFFRKPRQNQKQKTNISNTYIRPFSFGYNEEQPFPTKFSRSFQQGLQKTESHFIYLTKQKQGLGKNVSYNKFFAMVDKQVQNSKKSFPI